MPVLDEPIQSLDETAVPDAPIESRAIDQSEGTGLRATRLAQAATLQSEARDIPPEQAFATLMQSNPMSGKGARAEAADELEAQTKQDALQLFADQFKSIEEPDLRLQAIAETEQADLEAKASEDYPLRKYVDAIAAPDMDPDRKVRLATSLYLSDKLQELQADIGIVETGTDILTAFIPGKITWDSMQAFGSINPLKQAENFAKLGEWFRGLPPEKQVEMWPALQEHVVDAMPRTFAVQFLQGIIDPAFQEGGEFDLAFWNSIEGATIAAGMITSGIKLAKRFNAIKAAASAGDKQRAAGTNLVVMQGLDNGAGRSMGVDRTTANTNALPFLSDDIDEASAAGDLSPAVHERIFQFRDKMKESFTDLSEGNTFVREGMLDKEDQARAVDRITKDYERYVASTYQGKDKIINLRKTKEDASGVTFEFEVTDAEGNVVKDTFRGNFTIDDVGVWQTLPRDSFILSEKAQANKTDFMSTVQAAIRLDNTAATVASQLRKVIKQASAPIRGIKGKPRKQRIKEVDAVLLAGDDLNKEFTPQELFAGVNGVKLDEAQIEYYYNMRSVMNGLGILRNMDARRAMAARGVKELRVGQDTPFFGSLVDDAADAARRARELKTVYKFEEGNNRALNVNQVNMADEYGNGYRLARLEEDVFIDGARYQHVLVKADSATELPAVVLDLKKGYIPRINPNATYFVQAFTDSAVNGVPDKIRKAVRSFDNRKEAEAFAAKMEAQRPAEFAESTVFRVVEDGELEAFRAGDTGITQTGGLVYSPRARKPIPHNDGDAATVPRMAALEAIELYLENTKNFMTRNEWRMGMRKKWENTAQMHLGGTRVSFDDPGPALANSQLAAAHRKIQEFSGFMDKGERMWENTVKGVYEWAIGHTGRGEISNFLLSQRQKDPAARLRAITFHTLLGTYNPIQLWVQAQGAAVALSVGSVRQATALKALRLNPIMTILQHVDFDDIDKLPAQIAKQLKVKPGTSYKQALAKMAGVEEQELNDLMTLWKKTGLYDSTLSSADVEAAARGYPTGAGAIKEFFNTGLLAFRGGELFNRRTAFLSAVDSLGGASKVLASDKLLKEALDKTNDMLLNLGKANRSAWQKGPLSIPTQFLQIQWKTLESLAGINGAFTPEQRIKLLMGQFALYGAAGAFGGAWALRQGAAMSGLDQIDIDNMSPGWLAAMTGGLTDWTLYMLGAESTAADRGALLNGMDQTVFSLFTDEQTAFEWLGGPSAVGPERFWKKLNQVWAGVALPQNINGEVSFSAQDVTDALRDMASDLSELAKSPFATGRQIDMFFLMRDLGQLHDTNGNLLAAPVDGFNWQTEWATLVGFKPDILQKKYDLSEINEDYRKTVEFRAQLLLQSTDKLLLAIESARKEGRDLTEDEIRRHQKRHNIYLNSITDPGLRRKVMESYSNKLRNRRVGESQWDRQQQTFWDNMVLDLADSVFDSNRLIQTGDEE
jgi:hypothetical protein